MDIGKMISNIMDKAQCIHVNDVAALCEQVKSILSEEPNVLRLHSPINICGDVHGQLKDIYTMFQLAGHPSEQQYLFLGNYINNGIYSVETIELLFLLKIKYPNTFFLLRGKHEAKEMLYVYGFAEHLYSRYGNFALYNIFAEAFNFLPLAAVIDNSYFSVHSGLSPLINMVDEISLANRCKNVPHEGVIADLLWSELSESVDLWDISPRGSGYLFGKKVVAYFTYINDLKLCISSHFTNGYEKMSDGKWVNICSDPNYKMRLENLGCVMKIHDSHEEYITLSGAHYDNSEMKNSFPQIL